MRFVLFAILSFSLFAAPVDKSRHATPDEAKITSSIVALLSENMFGPYRFGANFEYESVGYSEDENGNIDCAYGTITENGYAIGSAFTVNHSLIWGDTATQLLYLTKDNLIHPSLFRHVMAHATSYIPSKDYNYCVLIEPLEDPTLPENYSLQRWSVQTYFGSHDFRVLLSRDETGFNYFTIY